MNRSEGAKKLGPLRKQLRSATEFYVIFFLKNWKKIILIYSATRLPEEFYFTIQERQC